MDGTNGPWDREGTSSAVGSVDEIEGCCGANPGEGTEGH